MAREKLVFQTYSKFKLVVNPLAVKLSSSKRTLPVSYRMGESSAISVATTPSARLNLTVIWSFQKFGLARFGFTLSENSGNCVQAAAKAECLQNGAILTMA